MRPKTFQFLLRPKCLYTVGSLVHHHQLHTAGRAECIHHGGLEAHHLLEVTLQGFCGQTHLTTFSLWHHDNDVILLKGNIFRIHINHCQRQ